MINLGIGIVAMMLFFLCCLLMWLWKSTDELNARLLEENTRLRELFGDKEMCA